jgi:acetyl-CoA/propionyl-CoA carboxylase biotin carboxyl carrier protein
VDLPENELLVDIGGRLMRVHTPGLASLGERAAAIREESGALRERAGGSISGDAVTAPMQGTIVTLAVEDGAEVAEGELVAVLEAMKMENPVNAHKSGTVTGLLVHSGESVAQGTVLCEIKD